MASKIMFNLHAEKPNGNMPGDKIDGANDPASLIPQGWQRAGALASFFAFFQPQSLTSLAAAICKPFGGAKRHSTLDRLAFTLLAANLPAVAYERLMAEKTL